MNFFKNIDLKQQLHKKGFIAFLLWYFLYVIMIASFCSIERGDLVGFFLHYIGIFLLIRFIINEILQFLNKTKIIPLEKDSKEKNMCFLLDAFLGLGRILICFSSSKMLYESYHNFAFAVGFLGILCLFFTIADLALSERD